MFLWKFLAMAIIKVKLEVTAHAFSKSAVAKIEAAEGKPRFLHKTTVEIMSKLTETFTNILKYRSCGAISYSFFWLLYVSARTLLFRCWCCFVSGYHQEIIWEYTLRIVTIFLSAVHSAMLQFLRSVLCHTSVHLCDTAASAVVPYFAKLQKEVKKGAKKLPSTLVMVQ